MGDTPRTGVLEDTGDTLGTPQVVMGGSPVVPGVATVPGVPLGRCWGCPLPGGDRGVPGVPREFRFTAEVPIWLDYRGKRVTMEQVMGTRPGGQRGGGQSDPWGDSRALGGDSQV